MIKTLRIALAFLLLQTQFVSAQGVGQLGSGLLWGNSTAARAPAAPTTVTGIVDRAISSTQGALFTRQGSAWVGLAPGTIGLPLVSGGAAANLSYAILGLSGGGTNANLTASNGGLFYSTATAAAILAGTATAGQIPRSGASAAPSWSTATYPATVAQGDILIGTSANVIAGLTKDTNATRALCNTGTSNAPAWCQIALATGVTGVLPVANGGTNCSVASGTCLDNITGFGTAGMVARTGAGTYDFRTIAGTSNRLTVTNGDGVAGAPTLDISSSYVGQSSITTVGTIATGLWQGTAVAVGFGGTGGSTTATSGRYLKGNGSIWATSTGSASGTGSCGAGDFVTALNSDGAPTCSTPAGGGTMTSVTPGAGLVSSVAAACSQTAITTSGTLSLAECVNAQTGTTYTVVDGDRAKLVTLSNTSAVAVTLPQAGASSAFQSGWFADFVSLNTGVVTITPTTSTIGGAATLVLNKNQRFRVVSDGTNYQIALGSLPSVVIQTFCPSGCSTSIASGSTGTYTPTAGMKYAVVEACGGGGGGGGATGSSATRGSGGGGGGAGGYSRSVITAANIDASKTVAIGALGTAGSAGANPGGNGGATTLDTTLVTANGGTGGTGATDTSGAVGGVGGTAGTGTLAAIGGKGGTGVGIFADGSVVQITILGGAGANSPYGSGGTNAGTYSTLVGGAALGYCSGGGGGAAYGTGVATAVNQAGGVGTAGLMIITEFVYN